MKPPSITLQISSGLTVLTFVFACAASAEIKNFAFKGVIEYNDDPAFLLDDSITVGGSFEGFYLFDTTTPDTNFDSTVGDYWHNRSQSGIVVKMGNYVFRSNPQHVNFLMEVVDRPNQDNYLLRSYTNVCSKPLGVDHISWQLDDSTGTAVSDANLPATPPVLSSWQSTSGFYVRGDARMPFMIRGKITVITETPAVIPEVPAVTIGEATEIRWESEMGYFYQIQKSPNLTDWTDVDAPVLGDGTKLSRFFSKPPGATLYYRAAIMNFP